MSFLIPKTANRRHHPQGSTWLHLCAILALVFGTLVATSVPTEAQRGRGRNAPNSKSVQNSGRFDIRILVLDPENNRETLGEIRPGETFVADHGKLLRLRMTVADGGKTKAMPQYPAARFSVVRSGGFVQVLKTQEAVGNMTFRGAKVTAGAAPVEVRFEILDNPSHPARDRVGSIFLAFERPVDEAPAPVSGLPGWPGGPGGVTLFEHPGFQGRSERFLDNDPQLNDNQIGADRASSVRLDPGCEVVIYEHPEFRGKATVVSSDLYDLNGSNVGADTASSIQLRCSDTLATAGPRGRGVVVFEHPNFQGRSERFNADDAQLSNNVIGADRASSVQVDAGCEVVLYEHPNFGGRSTLMRESVANLSGSHLGADTASSLTVRCN